MAEKAKEGFTVSEESKKRYAMVIDVRKCVGCMSCMATCKMENAVPLESFRSWVDMAEKGTYPQVNRTYMPKLCNHCEDAPCVEVCPTKASYRREDGVVLVDESKCIGCGYCIEACPYHARFMNGARSVADKCTFCADRADEGLEPACVRNCMGKARVFGDIGDPESAVSKIVSTEPVRVLHPEFGTAPAVYYIGADFSE